MGSQQGRARQPTRGGSLKRRGAGDRRRPAQEQLVRRCDRWWRPANKEGDRAYGRNTRRTEGHAERSARRGRTVTTPSLWLSLWVTLRYRPKDADGRAGQARDDLLPCAARPRKGQIAGSLPGKAGRAGRGAANERKGQIKYWQAGGIAKGNLRRGLNGKCVGKMVIRSPEADLRTLRGMRPALGAIRSLRVAGRVLRVRLCWAALGGARLRSSNIPPSSPPFVLSPVAPSASAHAPPSSPALLLLRHRPLQPPPSPPPLPAPSPRNAPLPRSRGQQHPDPPSPPCPTHRRAPAPRLSPGALQQLPLCPPPPTGAFSLQPGPHVPPPPRPLPLL
ncbi:hypothetical protein BC628DRAFT_586229 [Trametes gibbosa]|nr:hypothetical protein BC628DRAFT_586229 [Trametes gibbosa]